MVSQQLAILGGKPLVDEQMRGELGQYSTWPIIDDEDIDHLVEFLSKLRHRQRRIGGSRNIANLMDVEEKYAEFVGTDYCLATSSGTAALHLALIGSGVEQGDEVLTPALSFIASSTCILHQNAIPVFVDIDPRTYNIDPAQIEGKITPRTTAILAVNLHGLPADYDAIQTIAQKHRLQVVEDGSHSHGAHYKGKRSGNLGQVGGASIVSNKILATIGEGGLLTTNDPRIFEKAKTARLSGQRVNRNGELIYDSRSMGWSYRPNEINLEFVKKKIDELDDHREARTAILSRLSEALEAFPVFIPPYVPDGTDHAYWVYRLRCNPERIGMDLDKGLFAYTVRKVLEHEGIRTFTFQTAPLPSFALFQEMQAYGNRCPWRCTGKKYDYRQETYPEATKTINESFCLFEMPPYPFRSDIELYVQAFEKLFINADKIYRLTQKYRAEYIPLTERLPEFY